MASGVRGRMRPGQSPGNESSGKGFVMKRRVGDERNPGSKERYEQSYGDADQGGWAPRRRIEDMTERSRYSSQRDRQEDRSGFPRGLQGRQELTDVHDWGARHLRGDERGRPLGEALASPGAPLGDEEEALRILRGLNRNAGDGPGRSVGPHRGRRRTPRQPASPRSPTGRVRGRRTT
jgi:hypothetical protein